MDNSWLVLRCGSNKTLALIAALEAADIECWSPLLQRMRRHPRTHKQEKVSLPALPSFVFLPIALEQQAINLRQRSPCPSFTVMRVAGKIVVLSDLELERMRSTITKQAKVASPLPAVGARVMINAGSFSGVIGVVIRNTKHDSWLLLDGLNMHIRFPPFLFDICGA